MALTHLVDTSVLARLDRPRIRSAIEAAAVRGELARAGVSDLEIGSCARNGVAWDRLMDALRVFELIETTSEHVVRARQVQRLVAKRHQRDRRVPELLVAAAAEARGLTVLHYDASFERIAAVTGQPCEWVVAPGSAD